MREDILKLPQAAAKKAVQLALSRGDDAVGTTCAFLASVGAGFVLALVLDRHFNHSPEGGA